MLTSFIAKLRQKLQASLTKNAHTPEYSARGSAIGLFVSLTPLVGVQIPVLLLVWAIQKRFTPNWNFNLVLALAWTWLTNIFTLPFFYYLFIMTGRLMLGNTDGLKPFDIFQLRNGAEIVTQPPVAGLWYQSMIEILQHYGLPLFIGWIPWAFLGSFVGYFWTLRFVINLNRRRTAKRLLK